MNRPLNILLRLLTIAGLLLVVLFCAFGFLSSFEHSSLTARLPWQLLYGGGGVLASFGILRTLRRVLESV
jgi:hypothetical protein